MRHSEVERLELSATVIQADPGDLLLLALSCRMPTKQSRASDSTQHHDGSSDCILSFPI